jgi:hypothetical protein
MTKEQETVTTPDPVATALARVAELEAENGRLHGEVGEVDRLRGEWAEKCKLKDRKIKALAAVVEEIASLLNQHFSGEKDTSLISIAKIVQAYEDTRALPPDTDSDGPKHCVECGCSIYRGQRCDICACKCKPRPARDGGEDE